MISASATIRDPLIWTRDATFTLVAALVLAVLGPFGTFDLPFGERLLHNLLYGFASFAFLWQPMRIGLQIGEQAGIPKLIVIAVGLPVLTVPVTLVCGFVAHSLDLEAGGHFFGAAYPIILSVVLPFGMAYLLVEKRLTARSELRNPSGRPPPPVTSFQSPRLLSRIPIRMRGEILALQAEDHYVRVHVKSGSAMVLMRMSDAILEMDDVEGHRVHRSWWVAKSAIEAANPVGRRLVLRLSNGLSVPVTREASARLRRSL